MDRIVLIPREFPFFLHSQLHRPVSRSTVVLTVLHYSGLNQSDCQPADDPVSELNIWDQNNPDSTERRSTPLWQCTVCTVWVLLLPGYCSTVVRAITSVASAGVSSVRPSVVSSICCFVNSVTESCHSAGNRWFCCLYHRNNPVRLHSSSTSGLFFYRRDESTSRRCV